MKQCLKNLLIGSAIIGSLTTGSFAMINIKNEKEEKQREVLSQTSIYGGVQQNFLGNENTDETNNAWNRTSTLNFLDNQSVFNQTNAPLENTPVKITPALLLKLKKLKFDAMKERAAWLNKLGFESVCKILYQGKRMRILSEAWEGFVNGIKKFNEDEQKGIINDAIELMGYFRYVKKYTVIINEEWLDDLISKSDSEDMSDGTETKTSDVSLSSSSSSNDNIENENANQSCFLNLVDNSKTLQNKGPRNFDNVEYWYGGNSGREWFWPCKNEEEFDKSLVSLKQLVRVLHQVKEGTAMVLQGNQITPENLLKFNKECSNLFDDLVVQQRIRTNVINFMRKGRGLIGFSGNCTDQDVENFFNSLLPSFLGISSDNVILETGNDAENKTTAGNFGELPLKILFKKCPGVTNQSVVFLTKKFKNVKKIFVKSCPNLTGEFIQEWTEK